MRVRDDEREVRKVIEDEGEDDETAQPHVARREGRLHVLFLRVTNRARAAIIDREHDRVVDVQDDRNEQEEADRPKDRTEVLQMFRVAVDPVRPEENLQVAEQVTDDEPEQNQPGKRDDNFPPDRSAMKGGKAIHNDSSLVVAARMSETRSRASAGQDDAGCAGFTSAEKAIRFAPR